ncbi:MAG: hypothetical protein AAF696_23740 [Bacteroidota bacterium]
MTEKNLNIAKWIMLFAAIYNLLWGAVISLFPKLMLFGTEAGELGLIMVQCIGMLVGVYGIAYYFSSRDPKRYWPLILVGLLGKILGPLGALFYLYQAKLPVDFLWTNLFNDLIWIPGFSWILFHIFKHNPGIIQKDLGLSLKKQTENHIHA